MKYFVTKDDKNVHYNDFKALLEEVFSSCLVINDIKDLEHYQIPLFPSEVSIFYYTEAMAKNQKFHSLLCSSKYVILITTNTISSLVEKINEESVEVINIGLNKTFVQWFAARIFKYLEKKHQLSFPLWEQEKEFITKIIISNRTSILRFCKTLFFVMDISTTLEYLKNLDNKQMTIKKEAKMTPFMCFYGYMMAAYSDPSSYSGEEVITSMIINNV